MLPPLILMRAVCSLYADIPCMRAAWQQDLRVEFAAGRALGEDNNARVRAPNEGDGAGRAGHVEGVAREADGQVGDDDWEPGGHDDARRDAHPHRD